MKIAYDPIYNFHSGYHKEIIESTSEQIEWVKSSLVNFYEDCVWNSRNIDLRSSLFNHGYFVFDTDCDLILSPHMLIENHTPYILELEKVNWLFADDYKHASKQIEPWKIKLFEGLVMKDNLRAIIWYSNSARNDFANTFAPKYYLDHDVIKKVEEISHVIYPASMQAVRNDFSDTKKNEFVVVANEKNWYRKGLDVVISIFTKLQKEGIENWSLKMVGGSLPENLLEKVSSISNKVQVTGLTSKSNFLNLLKQSDCLLVPSRAETFGTVMVQAINSGCFVIANFGPNTFATREALEPWVNASYIIDSFKGDDESDIPNEPKFYESVKDFILNPKPHPRERPVRYSRKHLSEKFLNIVNNLQSGKK